MSIGNYRQIQRKLRGNVWVKRLKFVYPKHTGGDVLIWYKQVISGNLSSDLNLRVLSHVVCEGRKNVEEKGFGFYFLGGGCLHCIIGYSWSIS